MFRNKKGLLEHFANSKRKRYLPLYRFQYRWRHVKPTKENKGGIISKESFIDQSNVKSIDEKKEKKVGKKWHQDLKQHMKKK